MKMLRKLSILFALALLAMAARAQEVHFNSAAEYDAWKAQLASEQTPVAPAHPGDTGDGGAERDGIASCDCWITPDASYTTINNQTQWDASGWGNGDDGSYGPVALPFSFYLYGQTYTQAYININGSVSFSAPVGTFSSSAFPTNGPSLVAPFWADVDLRGGGPNQNKVQYKVTPTALYVNWTNVGYYNQQLDKLNSFQVIITNGSDPIVPGSANVSFCYGTMQWTTGSASGGSNGFGGTPATVGANKGDGVNYIQFGRFDHAGTDYNGPFGAPGGISWLTGKYFSFATDITVGNLNPVIAGQSVCDSLIVCTGVTSQLSVEFLSPEPAQITVPSSVAPTLSNYTTVDSVAANVALITTEFTPTAADIGYHDVYFTGQDNGTPPLSSTLHIVVQVLQTPQLQNDTMVVCDNAAPVNMLPVLGPTAQPGGTWTGPDGSAHTGIFDPLTDPEGPYTYFMNTGGQCDASGTAYMLKMPHADAGNDGNLAFCSWDLPEPLFPMITGTPQAGGAWFSPDGSAFAGTLDPATAAEGTYQYVKYGDSPCPNDTAFIHLAIPRSVDAGLNNNLALCRDAQPFSMRSQLGGTPDATGVWTSTAGAIMPDLFDPATGEVGIYTYTVSAVLPCPAQTATLTINLNELPYAGTDSSLVVCGNSNNTMLFPLLGNEPDTGGHWLDPLGGVVDDGLLKPMYSVTGNFKYVSVGLGACAHRSDTAVVAVQINPLPVITYTAVPDSGCNPLDVVFTNTTDPIYVGGNCVWDFGDGSSPENACGTVSHTYTEPGWYHVKLRITTPEGCTDQLIDQGAVLVDPAPKATFTYTPNPGSAGNSRLVFTATDPHATIFQWYLPDGTAPTGPQAAYQFPDKIADTYTVCLYVADRYGCEDTQCDTTITIQVPNLWVPLGFTPDGNGINDEFKPVMLDMALEDYHLMVFDRWGRLQFETRDAEKGWDGTGTNGNALPTGVYVWRIKYRPLNSSDLQEQFGYVVLNK